MDRRYYQGETDFSSDTVIGLIVPPEQISVGSYTTRLNQASCLTALAVSSLPSHSLELHVCSASAYSDFECGVV